MSQIPTSHTLEESSSSSMESTVTTEEIEPITPFVINTERTNPISSDTLQTVNETYSDIPKFIENSTTVIVTSPSITSDLTNEQKDSIDPLIPSSSLNYLQTKHRRNKSEPVKSLSTDDLPSLTTTTTTTTTTNESSTSNNNAKDETRRKSSSKIKQNLDDKPPSTPTTSTSKKKKAWYNPFQSTYRQRNDEFHKLFKNLPSTERLIVDYSCAWQRDILAQGRMYISSNHLCFYANILNWKSSLNIPLKDITSITREKTAKVISNAIEVKTEREKYFFASFVTRDKTFGIIEKIWSAARQDQSITGQQLWVIIHENYGDNLDMTTDDDDDHHQQQGKSTIISSSSTPITAKYDRIPNDLMTTRSSQQDDDRSSLSSRGEHQSDDESEIIDIQYLSTCPCENHLATELINRTYSMSVEHLFDCIFGENDFLKAYRASRRIKDYQSDDWQIDNESGKRERQCTYKVSVAAMIGSTTICSTEQQIIESELNKSYYIVDTEVRNEGIRYADTFYVASRYCLVQIAPNRSHLKVTCEVRYIKSLMAIIKTFIEKNAMAALQDSYTDLMKRLEQESSKQNRKQNQHADESLDTTRIKSEELTSSINDLSVNTQLDDDDDDDDGGGGEEEFTQEQKNVDFVQTDGSYLFKNKFLLSICILTMLLLLIVNIFLCIKLNQIDHMTDRLVQNYPVWLNRYSYQDNENQWTVLLKKQEEYYQTQIISLQSVLITTHDALQNVTNTLNQLSQLSSRST